MADRRPLGVQDALWLEMDRPNNLMVVDSVIWTAEPLDWGRVRQSPRNASAPATPCSAAWRSRTATAHGGGSSTTISSSGRMSRSPT